MSMHLAHSHALTRRQFLADAGRFSLGAIALQTLLARGAEDQKSEVRSQKSENPLWPKAPPLPAKAKAVIYLSMAGAPPQHDSSTGSRS